MWCARRVRLAHGAAITALEHAGVSGPSRTSQEPKEKKARKHGFVLAVHGARRLRDRFIYLLCAAYSTRLRVPTIFPAASRTAPLFDVSGP